MTRIQKWVRSGLGLTMAAVLLATGAYVTPTAHGHDNPTTAPENYSTFLEMSCDGLIETADEVTCTVTATFYRSEQHGSGDGATIVSHAHGKPVTVTLSNAGDETHYVIGDTNGDGTSDYSDLPPITIPANSKSASVTVKVDPAYNDAHHYQSEPYDPAIHDNPIAGTNLGITYKRVKFTGTFSTTYEDDSGNAVNWPESGEVTGETNLIINEVGPPGLSVTVSRADVHPGETVDLAAHASASPAGTGLTYAWTHRGGPGVLRVDANDPSRATFTVGESDVQNERIYIELVVTGEDFGNDGAGLSTKRNVFLPMLGMTQPALVARILIDERQSIFPGHTVHLQGDNSSNGLTTPLTYAWEQVSGPHSVALSSASAANVSFTVPSSAAIGNQYEIQLTVTNSRGTSDSTTKSVMLNALSAPLPTAVAEVSGWPGGYEDPAHLIEMSYVAPGETVSLYSNRSSSGDGTGYTVSWSQVGGSTVSLTKEDSSKHQFTVPSNAADGAKYRFDLTVTNNYGLTATDQAVAVVHVEPPQGPVNTAPLAFAGEDQRVKEGTVVTLDGSRSSDRETAKSDLEYSWGQISGPPVILCNHPSPGGAGTGTNKRFHPETNVLGRCEDDRDGALAPWASSNPWFIAPQGAHTLIFELVVWDQGTNNVAQGYPLSSSNAVTMIVEAHAAPTVSAERDTTARPGDPVVLGATGTTHGNIAYWRWRQVEGPTITNLDGINRSVLKFTVPADATEGTVYGFEVSLRDDQGREALDEVRVTVVAPQNPVVPVVRENGNVVATWAAILNASLRAQYGSLAAISTNTEGGSVVITVTPK